MSVWEALRGLLGQCTIAGGRWGVGSALGAVAATVQVYGLHGLLNTIIMADECADRSQLGCGVRKCAMAVTERAVADAPAAKQPVGMLESVRVRGFRGFQDLRVEGLGRINLFTGRNNSGKTSLLEAMALLAGAGFPSLAFNPIVTRGAELLAESESASGISVRESVWKPMFRGLDFRKEIKIEARHSRLGSISLDVDFAPRKNVEIKTSSFGGKSVITLQDTLGFIYHSSETGTVSSQALMDEQGRQIAAYTGDSDSEPRIPIPSAYLVDRGGSQIDDARNLAEVRRQKRGESILDALRIIEPRIESIEDNSSSGTPMIWADIGLRELVPLAALGGGLPRAARLLTGMIHVEGGMLMVDEIDNGFHHSVVPKIWKIIDDTSREFGVQVFATTHSYECVESAHSALGDHGFTLHRVESKASGSRCVTYSPDALRGAVRHSLEVR